MHLLRGGQARAGKRAKRIKSQCPTRAVGTNKKIKSIPVEGDLRKKALEYSQKRIKQKKQRIVETKGAPFQTDPIKRSTMRDPGKGKEVFFFFLFFFFFFFREGGFFGVFFVFCFFFFFFFFFLFFFFFVFFFFWFFFFFFPLFCLLSYAFFVFFLLLNPCWFLLFFPWSLFPYSRTSIHLGERRKK